MLFVSSCTLFRGGEEHVSRMSIDHIKTCVRPQPFLPALSPHLPVYINLWSFFPSSSLFSFLSLLSLACCFILALLFISKTFNHRLVTFHIQFLYTRYFLIWLQFQLSFHHYLLCFKRLYIFGPVLEFTLALRTLPVRISLLILVTARFIHTRKDFFKQNIEQRGVTPKVCDLTIRQQGITVLLS